MAIVIEKANPSNFRVSANTPDFPAALWLHDPAGFAALSGTVPAKYWKLFGVDDIEEMTAIEKTSVDTAEASALATATHSALTNEVDATLPTGVDVRAIIHLLNKRDNYLTNRVVELQNRVQAMLDSTGAVANMRVDGLAVSISATNTRTLADAVNDYKTEINSGVAD